MSESPIPADSKSKKSSRAGRNLSAAIAVGLSLIALVLVSLFVVKTVFAFVVMVALTIAIFEISQAMRTAGINLHAFPVAIGGVAAMAVTYFADPTHTIVVFAITIIAVFLWRLPGGQDGFVRDVSAGVFGLGYLFVMGTVVMLMLSADDGHWRVLVFIGCTVASDIGGYAAGVLFGKHPLAPSISPKKSWEGLVGSVIGSSIVGVLIVVYGLDVDWWVGIILGALCAVVGTLGDLCESLIKRDLGIKDMGNLLPGHGGIMDRLDSLVVVAPFAFIAMYALI